jgi:membrane-associated protein
VDLLEISLRELINPQFYIEHGGLWMILFIVFAETGLFMGFFLPGDALLFVTGIYSSTTHHVPGIVASALFETNNQWVDLFILWLLISVAGIAGNFVGYWFGKKSGPFLFERRDSFLFKKKYLLQAHDFYEKNGGEAIILARFVPFVRTFAPIVAGIVAMNWKRFSFYNITGCILWVGTMLFAGHFLQAFMLKQFDFNLKDHIEIIVLVIVLVTTLPVIWKFVSHGKKSKK